jgi:6-phosphofructokinase 1
MVDTLQSRGVDMLFTIGGDGTLRGAGAIAQEIERRGLPISLIGIPKTIDNDLMWIERSFGFYSAVEEARRAVQAAQTEASSVQRGVGLVKLMGRHSGFIAAHAGLADNDVDFCLIPEARFRLDGDTGLFRAIEEVLKRDGNALIVVAEGAGQELLPPSLGTDSSGNKLLQDIGAYLKAEIKAHFKAENRPVDVKYIDPSYIVRGLPANASDSEFCLTLGQHAVHAALSGRTNMLVGYWNQRYTHLPISVATRGRKQIAPGGRLWRSILSATGQPPSLCG